MRLPMRKIWLLTIFLFLFSSMAYAGDGIQFGGHGGIHFGGLYWNVSKLNDFLDSADVDTLPYILPAIGGGGQAIIFEKVIIGARGSAVGYNLGGNNMSVDVGISYGFLDIGYAAINSKQWLLATVAGVGGSTVRITLDGDVTQLGLQKYSDKFNPHEQSGMLEDKLTMTTSGAIGHVGIALYHQVRFAQSEGGGFGAFLPGISAGWIFDIGRGGWEIDGEDVPEGPSFSPHGVYLQLELHFGGGITSSEKSAETRGKNSIINCNPTSIPANNGHSEEIVGPKDAGNAPGSDEKEEDNNEDKTEDGGDAPVTGSDNQLR